MRSRLLRKLILSAGLLLIPIVAHANAGLPLTWFDMINVAEGRGERGPWKQNDSRYDFVDDPTVAIDGHGRIVLSWVDQGRKDVFFQRFSSDGKPEGNPVNVSRSPSTFSWLPRVITGADKVLDASQKIFILWQEIIFSGGSHGGEILVAASKDGGRSFSEPVNISSSIGGDGKGRITKDHWHNGSVDFLAGEDGKLYAAWTEYDGQLWFSISADEGRSFSRPQRIAGGDVSPARAPSLALGPDRTIYLAWAIGEDPGADIRLSKSVDGGKTFSQPRIIAASEQYSDAPRLAVDANGIVHMVFAESSGGPFERYHIRYTRSSNGGDIFEMPREISGSVSNTKASAAFPGLGIDASGRLYVIWEQYRNDRHRPRGLAITMSQDSGKYFYRPATVPGSSDPEGGFNGSTQGLLMKKLAVNDHGHIAVVNSSFKPDRRSRVWLMRGAFEPSTPSP